MSLSSVPQVEGAAIAFPDGLPGFEQCRQFVLIASPALDPFTCLSGIGPNAPSFLAIDPRRVLDDYSRELSTADLARLEAAPGQSLLWLAIISPNEDGARVNLRAPLVINPDTMRGLQLLDMDETFAVDHPLYLV
jgi:flagellar assembly factor FliW